MTSAVAGYRERLAEHNELRTATLEGLIASLKSFPRDSNREAFSRLFRDSQALLEADDQELSEILRVSRPTIGRWARGESAPHPLAWEPVFRTLAGLAEAKLRRRGAELSRYAGQSTRA